jgi:hypothetical protein
MMLATLLRVSSRFLRQDHDLCHPAAPLPVELARGGEPALSEVEGDLRPPSLPPSSSVNIGVYEAIAEFTLGVVMCQKPLVAR